MAKAMTGPMLVKDENATCTQAVAILGKSIDWLPQSHHMCERYMPDWHALIHTVLIHTHATLQDCACHLTPSCRTKQLCRQYVKCHHTPGGLMHPLTAATYTIRTHKSFLLGSWQGPLTAKPSGKLCNVMVRAMSSPSRSSSAERAVAALMTGNKSHRGNLINMVQAHSKMVGMWYLFACAWITSVLASASTVVDFAT